MPSSVGRIASLIAGVDNCNGNLECIRRLEGARNVREGGGSFLTRPLRRAAGAAGRNASTLGRAGMASRSLGLQRVGLVGDQFGTRRGSEPPSGSPLVPGNFPTGNGGSGGADPLGLGGDCPGLTSIKFRGRCVELGDILPGGDPAVTDQVPTGNGSGDGGMGVALPFSGPSGGAFSPVNGRFGVGVVPRVEVMQVRRCPKGMALGIDGVCYDGLHRNSPRREHPLGMKPLLTSGDRAAIRKASAAAGKLARSKKSLKKAAKALEKAF